MSRMMIMTATLLHVCHYETRVGRRPGDCPFQCLCGMAHKTRNGDRVGPTRFLANSDRLPQTLFIL
ncbi:uncharacterized protein BDW43DRAFT_259480 [Aspergillus alliaceus]|uniref:uncharacterized protein n=1 Tax=Petromyces alliaceus TaxID=209559 RepID=UPI0012A6E054|nr:uncharacterized protein BDW43DRAFT_259480 [Aspergillus alliaceus]KAB8239856.1 hypothetical protein BDW43DRAFT_259480 [Aspergillus alliaceus]